jgi:hypothetical protein
MPLIMSVVRPNGVLTAPGLFPGPIFNLVGPIRREMASSGVCWERLLRTVLHRRMGVLLYSCVGH